jgi:hypothetical protein
MAELLKNMFRFVDTQPVQGTYVPNTMSVVLPQRPTSYAPDSVAVSAQPVAAAIPAPMNSSFAAQPVAAAILAPMNASFAVQPVAAAKPAPMNSSFAAQPVAAAKPAPMNSSFAAQPVAAQPAPMNSSFAAAKPAPMNSSFAGMPAPMYSSFSARPVASAPRDVPPPKSVASMTAAQLESSLDRAGRAALYDILQREPVVMRAASDRTSVYDLWFGMTSAGRSRLADLVRSKEQMVRSRSYRAVILQDTLLDVLGDREANPMLSELQMLMTPESNARLVDVIQQESNDRPLDEWLSRSLVSAWRDMSDDHQNVVLDLLRAQAEQSIQNRAQTSYGDSLQEPDTSNEAPSNARMTPSMQPSNAPPNSTRKLSTIDQRLVDILLPVLSKQQNPQVSHVLAVLPAKTAIDVLELLQRRFSGQGTAYKVMSLPFGQAWSGLTESQQAAMLELLEATADYSKARQLQLDTAQAFAWSDWTLGDLGKILGPTARTALTAAIQAEPATFVSSFNKSVEQVTLSEMLRSMSPAGAASMGQILRNEDDRRSQLTDLSTFVLNLRLSPQTPLTFMLLGRYMSSSGQKQLLDITAEQRVNAETEVMLGWWDLSKTAQVSFMQLLRDELGRGMRDNIERERESAAPGNSSPSPFQQSWSWDAPFRPPTSVPGVQFQPPAPHHLNRAGMLRSAPR